MVTALYYHASSMDGMVRSSAPGHGRHLREKGSFVSFSSRGAILYYRSSDHFICLNRPI